MRSILLLLCLLLPLPAAAQQELQQQNVPFPDPTQRTVEQLTAAILAQEKLFNAQIERLRGDLEALRKLGESRLLDIDKATNLRLAEVDKFPEMIDAAAKALTVLMEQRFLNVDTRFDNVKGQFEARDREVDRALKATQDTANNALIATKEAVITAARVTDEKLSAQKDFTSEVTDSLRSDVNKLSSRLDTLDGRTAGLGEAKVNYGDNVGIIGVLIGAGLGIAGLFIGLRRPPPERIVERVIQGGHASPTTTTTTAAA